MPTKDNPVLPLKMVSFRLIQYYLNKQAVESLLPCQFSSLSFCLLLKMVSGSGRSFVSSWYWLDWGLYSGVEASWGRGCCLALFVSVDRPLTSQLKWLCPSFHSQNIDSAWWLFWGFIPAATSALINSPDPQSSDHGSQLIPGLVDLHYTPS